MPLCGRRRYGLFIVESQGGGCFRLRTGVLSRTSSHVWGQLELANVPIEGWIIDPDVHGLFDGPCDVVHLSTHYGEVVHTDVMDLWCWHSHRWGKGP